MDCSFRVVSTHSRCTIGGMAGNNSCGAKSIRYGLMADNVIAIDAILADGARCQFGPDWPADATGPDGIAQLARRLKAIGVKEATEMAARFPRQLRRVGGYNIDALTPAAAASGRGESARLLVGSEGTLAFSPRLRLSCSRSSRARSSRASVNFRPFAPRWRRPRTSSPSVPERWSSSTAR